MLFSRAIFVLVLSAGVGLVCPSGHQAAAPSASGQSAPAQPAAKPKHKPDVPYVPTPPEVVDEMLRLAHVTKDDVLYDLGCGDGRIVITAAERFGTRGVGVDIDPVRVKEARENAEKAGVSDRVTFLEQDLFETDIREATVVALYLLPSLNLKLRPKLFAELKPGTRVVSHYFDMGDWKPEATSQIGESPVYFWVIPTNAATKAPR